MKCTVCSNEFEPKRADAKFCSSTCRSREARIYEKTRKKGNQDFADMIDAVKSAHAPEKIKKGHCPQCVTFESGVHFCPNGNCGCWQTKEEQERELDEMQKKCVHPRDMRYYSRCLDCGAIMVFKRTGRTYLSKEFCKKHDFTLKSSCGCK